MSCTIVKLNFYVIYHREIVYFGITICWIFVPVKFAHVSRLAIEADNGR